RARESDFGADHALDVGPAAQQGAGPGADRHIARHLRRGLHLQRARCGRQIEGPSRRLGEGRGPDATIRYAVTSELDSGLRRNDAWKSNMDQNNENLTRLGHESRIPASPDAA